MALLEPNLNDMLWLSTDKLRVIRVIFPLCLPGPRTGINAAVILTDLLLTYLTWGLPRLSHPMVTLRQLLGFSSLVFSRSVCSGQQTSSVQDLSDLLVVVCRLTHVLGL